MNNFIAIVFAILLTVLIGMSAFMGDTNSVKASIMDLITKTNTEIQNATK